MLKVKKLHPNAILPTVAHPGEDLGYDLYALEETWLEPFKPTVVKTGIAAQAFYTDYPSSEAECSAPPLRCGLLIRDRSSMAKQGIITVAGVVDHGYTGEIGVMMVFLLENYVRIRINAGDKIAQMVPVPLLTGTVQEVAELATTSRGADGYGSTGTR